MKGLSIELLTLMMTIVVGKATTKPGCKVNTCFSFLANFLEIKGEHVFAARMGKLKNIMERPKHLKLLHFSL